jgi:hypothetical protein
MDQDDEYYNDDDEFIDDYGEEEEDDNDEEEIITSSNNENELEKITDEMISLNERLADGVISLDEYNELIIKNQERYANIKLKQLKDSVDTNDYKKVKNDINVLFDKIKTEKNSKKNKIQSDLLTKKINEMIEILQQSSSTDEIKLGFVSNPMMSYINIIIPDFPDIDTLLKDIIKQLNDKYRYDIGYGEYVLQLKMLEKKWRNKNMDKNLIVSDLEDLNKKIKREFVLFKGENKEEDRELKKFMKRLQNIVEYVEQTNTYERKFTKNEIYEDFIEGNPKKLYEKYGHYQDITRPLGIGNVLDYIKNDDIELEEFINKKGSYVTEDGKTKQIYYIDEEGKVQNEKSIESFLRVRIGEELTTEEELEMKEYMKINEVRRELKNIPANILIECFGDLGINRPQHKKTNSERYIDLLYRMYVPVLRYSTAPKTVKEYAKKVGEIEDRFYLSRTILDIEWASGLKYKIGDRVTVDKSPDGYLRLERLSEEINELKNRLYKMKIGGEDVYEGKTKLAKLESELKSRTNKYLTNIVYNARIVDVTNKNCTVKYESSGIKETLDFKYVHKGIRHNAGLEDTYSNYAILGIKSLGKEDRAKLKFPPIKYLVKEDEYNSIFDYTDYNPTEIIQYWQEISNNEEINPFLTLYTPIPNKLYKKIEERKYTTLVEALKKTRIGGYFTLTGGTATEQFKEYVYDKFLENDVKRLTGILMDKEYLYDMSLNKKVVNRSQSLYEYFFGDLYGRSNNVKFMLNMDKYGKFVPLVKNENYNVIYNIIESKDKLNMYDISEIVGMINQDLVVSKDDDNFIQIYNKETNKIAYDEKTSNKSIKEYLHKNLNDYISAQDTYIKTQLDSNNVETVHEEYLMVRAWNPKLNPTFQVLAYDKNYEDSMIVILPGGEKYRIRLENGDGDKAKGWILYGVLKYPLIFIDFDEYLVNLRESFVRKIENFVQINSLSSSNEMIDLNLFIKKINYITEYLGDGYEFNMDDKLYKIKLFDKSLNEIVNALEFNSKDKTYKKDDYINIAKQFQNLLTSDYKEKEIIVNEITNSIINNKIMKYYNGVVTQDIYNRYLNDEQTKIEIDSEVGGKIYKQNKKYVQAVKYLINYINKEDDIMSRIILDINQIKNILSESNGCKLSNEIGKRPEFYMLNRLEKKNKEVYDNMMEEYNNGKIIDFSKILSVYEQKRIELTYLEKECAMLDLNGLKMWNEAIGMAKNLDKELKNNFLYKTAKKIYSMYPNIEYKKRVKKYDELKRVYELGAEEIKTIETCVYMLSDNNSETYDILFEKIRMDDLLIEHKDHVSNDVVIRHIIEQIYGEYDIDKVNMIKGITKSAMKLIEEERKKKEINTMLTNVEIVDKRTDEDRLKQSMREMLLNFIKYDYYEKISIFEDIKNVEISYENIDELTAHIINKYRKEGIEISIKDVKKYIENMINLNEMYKRISKNEDIDFEEIYKMIEEDEREIVRTDINKLSNIQVYKRPTMLEKIPKNLVKKGLSIVEVVERGQFLIEGIYPTDAISYRYRDSNNRLKTHLNNLAEIFGMEGKIVYGVGDNLYSSVKEEEKNMIKNLIEGIIYRRSFYLKIDLESDNKFEVGILTKNMNRYREKNKLSREECMMLLFNKEDIKEGNVEKVGRGQDYTKIIKKIKVNVLRLNNGKEIMRQIYKDQVFSYPVPVGYDYEGFPIYSAKHLPTLENFMKNGIISMWYKDRTETKITNGVIEFVTETPFRVDYNSEYNAYSKYYVEQIYKDSKYGMPIVCKIGILPRSNTEVQIDVPIETLITNKERIRLEYYLNKREKQSEVEYIRPESNQVNMITNKDIINKGGYALLDTRKTAKSKEMKFDPYDDVWIWVPFIENKKKMDGGDKQEKQKKDLVEMWMNKRGEYLEKLKEDLKKYGSTSSIFIAYKNKYTKILEEYRIDIAMKIKELTKKQNLQEVLVRKVINTDEKLENNLKNIQNIQYCLLFLIFKLIEIPDELYKYIYDPRRLIRNYNRGVLIINEYDVYTQELYERNGINDGVNVKIFETLSEIIQNKSNLSKLQLDQNMVDFINILEGKKTINNKQDYILNTLQSEPLAEIIYDLHENKMKYTVWNVLVKMIDKWYLNTSTTENGVLVLNKIKLQNLKKRVYIKIKEESSGKIRINNVDVYNMDVGVDIEMRISGREGEVGSIKIDGVEVYRLGDSVNVEIENNGGGKIYMNGVEIYNKLKERINVNITYKAEIEGKLLFKLKYPVSITMEDLVNYMGDSYLKNYVYEHGTSVNENNQPVWLHPGNIYDQINYDRISLPDEDGISVIDTNKYVKVCRYDTNNKYYKEYVVNNKLHETQEITSNLARRASLVYGVDITKITPCFSVVSKNLESRNRIDYMVNLEDVTKYLEKGGKHFTLVEMPDKELDYIEKNMKYSGRIKDIKKKKQSMIDDYKKTLEVLKNAEEIPDNLDVTVKKLLYQMKGLDDQQKKTFIETLNITPDFLDNDWFLRKKYMYDKEFENSTGMSVDEYLTKKDSVVYLQIDKDPIFLNISSQEYGAILNINQDSIYSSEDGIVYGQDKLFDKYKNNEIFDNIYGKLMKYKD